MRVQLIGVAALVRLMGDGRSDGPDLSWLIHGPEDDDWVEPSEASPPAILLAAE